MKKERNEIMNTGENAVRKLEDEVKCIVLKDLKQEEQEKGGNTERLERLCSKNWEENVCDVVSQILGHCISII